MARILIIEDSEDYQEVLSISLGREHDIEILGNADRLGEEIREFQPDLLLLDINLPGKDGFEVALELKSDPHASKIPLLFVTARRDTDDIVKGFSLGADDYILKPFDPAELRARCESKIKKQLAQKTQENFLKLGKLRLDLIAQRAFEESLNGELELELTAAEFRLLSLFANSYGRTLSRDEIYSHLNSGEAFRPGDRSIDAHISALRKKSSLLSDYIESVYGSGYRFLIA